MANDIRAAFLTGLRNAHALESQALSLMNAQVDRLNDYPELQQKISSHIAETETQRARLEKILSGLGEDNSSLKDAAASIMGQFAALSHTVADDEVLKNLFADIAFENYEASAYVSLLSIANIGGFDAATQPLAASLKEEEAMSNWLKSHIEPVTHRYLQLASV